MHLRPKIHRQTGASIVALMVGIAIGLFILAGALMLYTSHVQNNRAVMLSMRLNQELRAVADLVARDLKRSGNWKNAIAGIASESAAGTTNPYAAITNDDATATLRFNYASDADNTVSDTEKYGFRLLNGVIQMTRDNGTTWDNLTDGATTHINNFAIVASNRSVATTEYCRAAPPAGTLIPTLTIRVFNLTIAGVSKADPSITRIVTESVRVRGDAITGACT